MLMHIKGVEKISVTLCSSVQTRRKDFPCKATQFQRDRLIVSTPLYCRISSYLQTMAAQGVNPLVAIQIALAQQNRTPNYNGGE